MDRRALELERLTLDFPDMAVTSSIPNNAYAAQRNHLDRRNGAAVPLRLSNGIARIEQSHRSG